MCATCGCSDGEATGATGSAAHRHGTGQDDGRDDRGRGVTLEQRVLAKNDLFADSNQDWLAARGVLAINMMSSPGSGKTTLLERTVVAAEGALSISVIVGDQQTSCDAERLRAIGCPVVQLNTGAGCHLDAEMVATALRALDPPERSIVLIENVGNLVCPALFRLGEHARVVLTSVTEGADKPRKYPYMFREADLVLINKVDLLPHVDFDVDGLAADAARGNARLEVRTVSALRGDGMPEWLGWLRDRIASSSSVAAASRAGQSSVSEDA